MNTILALFAAASFALASSQFLPPSGAGPVAAPSYLLPAPPQPAYKTEMFQTPHLSKAEIRDDAGQYSLSYVTQNGIRVTERSFLKLYGGSYVPVKEGTYQYISPEGIPVAYGYRADENGYVVTGYPLPIAPTDNKV